MIYVVIAAGDAEREVARILAGLREVGGPSRERHRVLVVDDASRDETALAVRGSARYLDLSFERHRLRLGIGAALRTGIRSALDEAQDPADVVVALSAEPGRDGSGIPALIRLLRRGAGAAFVADGAMARETAAERAPRARWRWPGRRPAPVRARAPRPVVVAFRAPVLRAVFEGARLPVAGCEAELLARVRGSGAAVLEVGGGGVATKGAAGAREASGLGTKTVVSLAGVGLD
jgi:hypothetical protein